jgi:hypothetical protein
MKKQTRTYKKPISIYKKTAQTKKRRTNISGEIVRHIGGWTIVSIRGAAFERGLAHGSLLHKELSEVCHVFPFLLKESYGTTYPEYMRACKKTIQPVVKKQYPEFYQEICGISAGAKRRGVDVSVDFLIGWNSYLSMSHYFGRSIERCSGFIACGDATEKGDLIMGHNTNTNFVDARFSNILMYVTPDKGYPFVMQTLPGFIASGMDWFICSTGMVGCETTIADTNYVPDFKHGVPYFCRIRQAMQYGRSLDEYSEILLDKNAGDYACSWLFGNVYLNEIMLCEIGLKEHNIKRTSNGVFYGMNSAMGAKLREKETNDHSHTDIKTSLGARNRRLHDLLFDTYYGKINMNIGKRILSDHYDVYLKRNVRNFRTICVHSESSDDPHNHRESHYPYGTVDGKVVNSELAKKLAFWAHLGPPCGTPFRATQHIKEHPEYLHWKPYLKDMPSHKWTEIIL